jgi:tRNA dimethylallyltransferase
LLDQGLASDTTALQAIGYKEFVACIQQNLPQETAINLIKQSSRRYAKRQLTWFRKMPELEWLENHDPVQNAKIIIENY